MSKKIKCAFCDGKGVDPFGLLSTISKCQVCGGEGSVTVEDPAIKCAFCKATGKHRDLRLPCLVCGGKGMVNAPKGAKECPDCGGRGVAPANYLPCMTCGGKGVIGK